MTRPLAHPLLLAGLAALSAACTERTPASELRYDSGVYVADAEDLPVLPDPDATITDPGDGGDAGEDPGPRTPTWVDDVQPIIALNCNNCHGTVLVANAPMSLVTYSDVTMMYTSARDGRRDFVYRFMADAVVSSDPLRVMPPGFPLTGALADTIVRWVAAGAPFDATSTGDGGTAPFDTGVGDVGDEPDGGLDAETDAGDQPVDTGVEPADTGVDPTDTGVGPADTGVHPDATIPDTGVHPDATLPDTGVHPDATIPDTGVHPDATVPDTGVHPDATIPDTGVHPDATVPDSGIHPDATIPDTGVHPDAMVPDSGIHPDAMVPDTGVHPDAAVPDTGVVPDAGTPPDSGVIDPLVGVGAVELVQPGFSFLEGPLWMPVQGVLLFSDVGFGRIHRLTPPNAVTVFRDPSNFGNGLALDPQGRLVSCEHDSRSVTRSAAIGGPTTPLVTNYQGSAFNSPNDVVIRSDGVMYFTDPSYGLGPRPRELAFNGMFRVNFSQTATTVTAEWQGATTAGPNGLVLSQNERVLFMADTAAATITRWDVAVADGALSNPTLFVNTAAGPDGMAIDDVGNLFVATQAGVQAYSPTGVLWGVIAVPRVPSNIAWGDADRRTLYITANDSLYRVRVVHPGVRD